LGLFWFTATTDLPGPLRPVGERADEFDALGIAFISLHEGVDTSDAKRRGYIGHIASELLS